MTEAESNTVVLIVRYTFWISVLVVWAKTIIGFHFSWEVCPCCGKKWGEHKNKGAFKVGDTIRFKLEASGKLAEGEILEIMEGTKYRNPRVFITAGPVDVLYKDLYISGDKDITVISK